LRALQAASDMAPGSCVCTLLKSSVLIVLTAVMWCRYGIYFGILGRDCAEVAADRMVPPGLSHACFVRRSGSGLRCTAVV